MFGNLSSFNGSLFDEFRRMEHEMEQLFGAGDEDPQQPGHG